MRDAKHVAESDRKRLRLEHPFRHLDAGGSHPVKTVGQALAWSAGLGLALAAVLSRAAVVQLGANLLAIIVVCIPAAVVALLFVMARAPGRLAIGLIVFPRVYQYARNLLCRAPPGVENRRSVYV